MAPATSQGALPSPYDTYASAGLRFLVELIAWIAGPWAAAELAGSGWVAVPAAIVLLALPSVFSTPGDKEQIVVPTPGPIRLAIEVVLSVVAAVGAWIVWPPWLGVAATAVAVAALVTGGRRAVWLARGAPEVA